jgi:hypothetical protein
LCRCYICVQFCCKTNRGRTNSGRQNFVERHLISSVYLRQFFYSHTSVCISLQSPGWQRQITDTFTDYSRIVAPQYGTCFLSPFWRLAFGGGFFIFVKYLDPYKYQTWCCLYSDRRVCRSLPHCTFLLTQKSPIGPGPPHSRGF